VSIPLDAILAIAADGTNLSCTLSPESVQLIFFGLSFLEDRDNWKADYFDPVTDSEWSDIQQLLSEITQEILP